MSEAHFAVLIIGTPLWMISFSAVSIATYLKKLAKALEELPDKAFEEATVRVPLMLRMMGRQ